MPTLTCTRREKLTVGEVDPMEYRTVSDLFGGRSFLQTASWAEVKADWTSELLALRDADRRIVGTSLVLYRRLPGLSR